MVKLIGIEKIAFIFDSILFMTEKMVKVLDKTPENIGKQ
jgi:hypothetical protein